MAEDGGGSYQNHLEGAAGLSQNCSVGEAGTNHVRSGVGAYVVRTLLEAGANSVLRYCEKVGGGSWRGHLEGVEGSYYGHLEVAEGSCLDHLEEEEHSYLDPPEEVEGSFQHPHEEAEGSFLVQHEVGGGPYHVHPVGVEGSFQGEGSWLDWAPGGCILGCYGRSHHSPGAPSCWDSQEIRTRSRNWAAGGHSLAGNRGRTLRAGRRIPGCAAPALPGTGGHTPYYSPRLRPVQEGRPFVLGAGWKGVPRKTPPPSPTRSRFPHCWRRPLETWRQPEGGTGWSCGLQASAHFPK